MGKKKIKAAAYNGARTVCKWNYDDLTMEVSIETPWFNKFKKKKIVSTEIICGNMVPFCGFFLIKWEYNRKINIDSLLCFRLECRAEGIPPPIFHNFWPITPLLLACIYYCPSANLATFLPLPPKKFQRLEWMVPFCGFFIDQMRI